MFPPFPVGEKGIKERIREKKEGKEAYIPL
jgi:hypothetical protein